MGMKEDNDEVTSKTRILSLELLQVVYWSSFSFSVHILICLCLQINKKDKNSSLYICMPFESYLIQLMRLLPNEVRLGFHEQDSNFHDNQLY